jgi:dephospho-CoA kinase
MRTREMSKEAAEQAIKAQRPAPPKRLQSHHVIENAGSLEDLKTAARKVWDALEERAPTS